MKPTGLTFPAHRGNDFVPLIEILLVVGEFVLERSWSIDGADFPPGWAFSSELNALAESGRPISGLTLVRLVADGVQTVGGEINGVGHHEKDIVIRSIRGDEWDVETAIPHLLQALARHFPDAVVLP